MIGEALVLASLLLTDPSGDAHGAGELVPPTAEVYSSTAAFDLTEVEILERSTLALRVRLGDRPDPAELPNGITLPVIDLYVDSGPGGNEELLPGPGLRMPAGGGWDVAIRVTGDRAFARRADEAADVEHPVTVTAEDRDLIVVTPFPAPEEAHVQALTGVYDAFGTRAWRPLEREPSPWSFSSPDAALPVVDVLAEDDLTQRGALRTGVLPEPRTRRPAAPWLVLMVLGLLIAVGGLVLRSRIGRDAATAPAADPDAPVPLHTERLPKGGADAAPEARGDAALATTPDDDSAREDWARRGEDWAMLAGGAAPKPATPADDGAAPAAVPDPLGDAMLSESDLFDAAEGDERPLPPEDAEPDPDAAPDRPAGDATPRDAASEERADPPTVPDDPAQDATASEPPADEAPPTDEPREAAPRPDRGDAR